MFSHLDSKVILGGMLAGIVLGVLNWGLGDTVPHMGKITGGLGLVVVFILFVYTFYANRRVQRYQEARNRLGKVIYDRVTQGKNPEWPYFVYLRPFYMDGKFVQPVELDVDSDYVERFGQPRTRLDLESVLDQIVYGIGKLVALSVDSKKVGACKIESTDKKWQDAVRDLCTHAEGVFIAPCKSESVLWEISLQLTEGRLDKCLFVKPLAQALNSLDFQKQWDDARVALEKPTKQRPGLTLPRYEDQGDIFRIVGKEIQAFHIFNPLKLSHVLPNVREQAADREKRKADLKALKELLTALAAANPK